MVTQFSNDEHRIMLPLISLVIVFLYFMAGGVLHFIITDFFVHIMPPYLPLHHAAVYVSGVFEIVGALGLVFRATRVLASRGLFVLTALVSLANIHMWQHPELFPEVRPEFLTYRLVAQGVLFVLIWQAGRCRYWVPSR